MAIVWPDPLLLTWLNPYACWIWAGVYPEFVGPGLPDGCMTTYDVWASGRLLSNSRDSSRSTRDARLRAFAERRRTGHRTRLELTGVTPRRCDRNVWKVADEIGREAEGTEQVPGDSYRRDRPVFGIPDRIWPG